MAEPQEEYEDDDEVSVIIPFRRQRAPRWARARMINQYISHIKKINP